MGWVAWRGCVCGVWQLVAQCTAIMRHVLGHRDIGNMRRWGPGPFLCWAGGPGGGRWFWPCFRLDRLLGKAPPTFAGRGSGGRVLAFRLL